MFVIQLFYRKKLATGNANFGNYKLLITDTLLFGSIKMCRNWLDNPTIQTSFSTVLPPNSGACMATNDTTYTENNRAIISLTSYHPGGVNVALGDGSVLFVSDTINCRTSKKINKTKNKFLDVLKD